MDYSTHGTNGHSEQPNGLVRHSNADIQKVRDLLFGDAQRVTEERLHLIERRLGEIEATLPMRMREIVQRLDALAGIISASQRDAYLSLSRAVAGLGHDIARLADEGTGEVETHADQRE